MKRIYTILAVIVLFTALSAQNYNTKFQFGLRGSLVVQMDEFAFTKLDGTAPKGFQLKDAVELKTSYEFRGFIRVPLTDNWAAELGGGMGRLRGLDYIHGYYVTDYIPVDLRAVYTPGDFCGWNPFFFAGAGIINYEVKEMPVYRYYQYPYKPVDQKGTAFTIPFGLGFQVALLKSVLLEPTITFNYNFTDDLNGFKEGKPNDFHISFGLGLTFLPSPLEEMPEGISGVEEKIKSQVFVDKDSDGDGLMDQDEIKKYKTDPNNVDTDGDGLNDGAEVTNYKTEPLIVDTDNDGLSDGSEVTMHKTNPLNKDTDGDALLDGSEVKSYQTDPLKTDTDNDGLTDGTEVNKYTTNPLKADTDEGKIADGIEVKRGSNPLDAKDDMPVEMKKVEFEIIYFATAKTVLTEESIAKLKNALEILKSDAGLKVQIQGHTDNVGKKSFNKKLSNKRAKVVMKWLVKNGIDATRLTIKGFGEDKPSNDNSTKEGRQKNRRVEFVIGE